jgi:beta-glucosidase
MPNFVSSRRDRSTRRRVGASSFLLFLVALGIEQVQDVVCSRAPADGDAILQDKARQLRSNLTLEEKISLVHGVDYGKKDSYIGNVPAIPRLGIPPVHMNDGPQGFRAVLHPGTSTAWPCALSMAATWDEELVYQWGQAMAVEFRNKGANVLLGPGVNVARVPQNGRNFEYLSGEDPVLGAKLVAAEIRAIQQQGVIANVKHFVHNNQETNRTTVNQVVDERTHWEVYMPPFVAAVEAGVLSVMCSYNKINGFYACENNSTLSADLKERLGFQGFVVSDWKATHSTHQAALAGLDMEMPGGDYFGTNLEKEIRSHHLAMSVLDDKVERITYALMASGAMNRTAPSRSMITANVTSDAHNKLARELAAAGVVLLKNDNHSLPLKIGDHPNIHVIGDIIAGGDGSGHVRAPYEVSGYQGITNVCGDSCIVTYSSMEEPDYSKIDSVDVVVVFTSTSSGENSDRTSLSFPTKELKVIETLTSMASHKVVVVGTTPGAVLLPFADTVPAVVVCFMPGQEAGNAIADVLFGNVNPSAKLPLTMPNKENEIEFSQEQYPGVNLTAVYSEKLLIGYRWYNANNIQPKFAFGFGLSYTKFQYSKIQVMPHSTISFQLSNVGSYNGSEVCQLYLSFPDHAQEPPKLLKDFQKVFLLAGQTTTVSFALDPQDFSVWADISLHDWRVATGTFTVFIGPSSDHLPLQVSISVNPAGAVDRQIFQSVSAVEK